jgi:hypothetical protein
MKRIIRLVTHTAEWIGWSIDRLVGRIPPGMSLVWPIMGLCIIISVATFFIFVAPDILVHKDIVPNGTDRAKVRHDDRATLLQTLTAFLILGGAYLTWQVTRAGQITDRFTRAVDQLGNSEVEIRLGGIYALERIAANSRKDRAAIQELLTAYVRKRAPLRSDEMPRKNLSTSPNSALRRILRVRRRLQHNSDRNSHPEEFSKLQFRAPDVQAVMVVLGHSPAKPGYIVQRLWLPAVEQIWRRRYCGGPISQGQHYARLT